MYLDELVRTWQAVTATSSRLRKTEAIAAVLARLPAAEVVAGVAYLSGELRQRQIGVGWATLRELPAPAAEPGLQVADVDAAFATIGEQSGAGSTARRRELLADLFGRATADEQRFLRQLLAGELRQGAQKGVMTDAVARAGGVAVAEVRRALLLQGDLRAVAVAVLEGGAEALAGFRLTPGRPLSPMLAAPGTDDVASALERIAPAALEWKLDGIRIQVHRFGPQDVRIFTRSLDDITARLPEIVAVARALPAQTAVLDGEVIALHPDGRPRPFQVTAGRVGAQTGDQADSGVRLTAMFFDLLHRDGVDYLDRPEADRFEALAALVPPELLIPRAVTDDPGRAQEFFTDAVRRGHEGVVVKDLQAPYDAGRRGSAWLKVKPRHTLDLVILAAEWGHGRRRGLLSNLHLGARDPDGGGFIMLGKTFKGLTDKMLAWQTERLQQLAVDPGDDWVVRVRPELVVEIAFDGVQRSSRYPGGLALRFARVKGYRADKSAAEADTIDTVREIHRMSGGEPEAADGGAAPDPR